VEEAKTSCYSVFNLLARNGGIRALPGRTENFCDQWVSKGAVELEMPDEKSLAKPVMERFLRRVEGANADLPQRRANMDCKSCCNGDVRFGNGTLRRAQARLDHASEQILTAFVVN
jgi:hypothetical protein